MKESPEKQIEHLANFIMGNVPGEPSASQGAVDTAIRLLDKCVKEHMNKGCCCSCEALEGEGKL